MESLDESEIAHGDHEPGARTFLSAWPLPNASADKNVRAPNGRFMESAQNSANKHHGLDFFVGGVALLRRPDFRAERQLRPTGFMEMTVLLC